MECEYCVIIKNKKGLIYEDVDTVVAVKDMVSIPGQISVFPKNHFTILELVPDEILKKCASLANKVGVAIFETMGCQGTNLIVQNGVAAGQKIPHFAIEILPRRENDGLNLQWEPKQLMEDDMDTTLLQIKEESNKLVEIGKNQEETKTVEQKIKPLNSTDTGDNYLLKSIRRRP